jgi:S1-C subfamily serine protease
MSDHHDQSENETSSLYADVGTSSLPSPLLRRKRLPSLISLLFIGALLCTGANSLPAVRGSAHPSSHVSVTGTLASGSPLSRQQVITQDQPAVVEIIAADCRDNGKDSGTGEIIDRRGYIVTNYHVVADGQKYYVLLFDNSLLAARLIGVDPADDLAVIKIDTSKRLSSVSIGNSSQLQTGDSTLAIGYPVPESINGIGSAGVIDGSTVTNGLISALGREMLTPGGGVILDAIQTDAEINAGNSGGALVNMQAQLIGITTQVPTYTYPNKPVITPDNLPIKGIGFAIPANRINFIVPQLIQNGKVVHSGHATLGAILVSVKPALATLDNLSVEHGAYISDAPEGYPASLAGLRVGDVIVGVNKTSIKNVMDLTDALMPEESGATVTLGIVRGTQRMRVTIILQELALHIKVPPIQHCSSASTFAPVVGKG